MIQQDANTLRCDFRWRQRFKNRPPPIRRLRHTSANGGWSIWTVSCLAISRVQRRPMFLLQSAPFPPAFYPTFLYRICRISPYSWWNSLWASFDLLRTNAVFLSCFRVAQSWPRWWRRPGCFRRSPMTSHMPYAIISAIRAISTLSSCTSSRRKRVNRVRMLSLGIDSLNLCSII